MLPLGKVYEQPLLSLTRICENGKLRCAVGAEFYFPFCSFDIPLRHFVAPPLT